MRFPATVIISPQRDEVEWVRTRLEILGARLLVLTRFVKSSPLVESYPTADFRALRASIPEFPSCSEGPHASEMFIGFDFGAVRRCF